MKRVLVYAPSADYMKEPSFRLRLAALAEPLSRRGVEWCMVPRPGGPVGRWLMARSGRKYDAVVLHRKWLDRYEAQALRGAMGAKRKVLMDIDDATMFHETELSTLSRARLERRVGATCAIVQVACTGNEYLAEFFQRHGVQTRVIPTVVDPAHYRLKVHAANEEVRLVWLGSKSTLKYLEEALPVLEAARVDVPGLRLVVVCDVAPRYGGALPVEFVPWSLEGESEALLKGDIGIAPTPENRWTLGKCGFKIVQYMAAGLPTVASPVGMNAHLARADTGMLAREPGEWRRAIVELARDVSLRARLGAAARARVEGELNIERAADAWAEALA